MTKTHQLSDVWLKASILGAMWAASEIILGSFLHNLRIPFNGNILTALGFILMIAASYKWKDKGLFWRSGLICALMKTMSPSAVIFGPMIAIFMESVLLEISVRTLGRNMLGFLVGASLAMSWILFQKIANFIIFYSFDIVGIYQQLMGFAGKQLQWKIDMVWSPIMVLFLIYLIFGMVAVYFGMKIGKNLNPINQENNIKPNSYPFDFLPKQNHQFQYSLTWLFFDFIALMGMLFLINSSPIYVWIPATIVVILIWISRYKRGLRQLLRPSFWFWFALITMLTAFAITGMKNDEGKWLEGLIIGLKMNFRAAIVIVGFAVLGTELYHPKIRNFFAKTSFKQLPVALELAFESLPLFINNLPEVKTFFTQPAVVIRNLIQLGEKRFNELKINNQIIILTGSYSQGKTKRLQELLLLLKEKNIKIDGFFSPRLLEGEQTVGYDLTDVNTNETFPFLRLTDDKNPNDIGKFVANQNTIQFFSQKLIKEYNPKTLLILDEIGKWEIQKKGWYQVIQHLHNQHNVVQLWVVRTEYLPLITDKFKNIFRPNGRNSSIFEIGKHTNQEILTQIINTLELKN